MEPKEARIIFLGTSPLSSFYLEALKKDGWRIVGLMDKKMAVDEVKKLSPDLGIMAYFGKILPPEILAALPRGILNVHHSLLPRWRGPSPVQAALLAGDEKTGVSILLTKEKVDAAEILVQRELPILAEDTYLSLEHRLIEIGVPLLLETLPLYLEGKIIGEAQNETQATYSHLIKTDDGKINWSRSVEEIHRQIRALNPEPGTFTLWNGKRLIIMEARLNKTSHNFKSGQVLAEGPDEERTDGDGPASPSQGGFKIAATGGFIIPTKIKLEGKKETTPSAFLKGYPQIIGSCLG